MTNKDEAVPSNSFVHWPVSYFGSVDVVRTVLQRGMGVLYFVAFLSVKLQCRALIGERGLLPVPQFLEHATFRDAPSLFHWRYTDGLLDAVAWAGMLLSACAVLGWTDAGPVWVSVACWLVLWALYLSVVNVGQRFFGFGWESMLLEAGIFTAFLGPRWMHASLVPMLCLRWMLFRTELGAGLIKLRHDRCWRDLTCLDFHYETQPLPNPLSWYFHRLPRWSHRGGVLVSHFTQVVVPFGLFMPQPYSAVAAGICTLQQVWLIVSGNYSWLNWLTALLGVAGCCDAVLGHAQRAALAPEPLWWFVTMCALGLLTAVLSVQPVLNLFSPRQMMNYSYNRYHLVNTYGAFGTVGRERLEIEIEGTRDGVSWVPYGFMAKPGDVMRRPPQVAPYHLRLDWLIWFLPFSVQRANGRVYVRGYDLWFMRFVVRLLEGDAGLLRLMGKNPFAEAPPVRVRALLYLYRYSDAQTKQATGAWWTRKLLGEYLPAVGLQDLEGRLP